MIIFNQGALFPVCNNSCKHNRDKCPSKLSKHSNTLIAFFETTLLRPLGNTVPNFLLPSFPISNFSHYLTNKEILNVLAVRLQSTQEAAENERALVRLFKIIWLANKIKGCQNIKQLERDLSEMTQNSNLWQTKCLTVRFQAVRNRKTGSE